MVINTLKNEAIKEGYEQGIKEAMKEAKEKAIKEVRKETLKEGKHTKALETAKNMLNKKLDIKLVSECTGLSVKEIENLQ